MDFDFTDFIMSLIVDTSIEFADSHTQKQSPEVFYQKVLLKISQIHWKIPISQSLF